MKSKFVALELDNGRLCYTPTCVIYKGKRYDAPVFLTTLQSQWII
jgi:hypothetical protein